MNLRKRAAVTPDVVAGLQAKVQNAKALQSVTDQKLLSDPRLNPETRADADRLQAERLATGLEMEHRRELRRVRETDRREEERIRAAAAVDAARAATDPSYTVLDLVRSRKTFSRVCLGASFVLSVGAAMSLETALATHYPAAADGVGYIAEITLTGMSTAAIIWAGKLARAGRLPEGLIRNLLVGLMVVPLVISMVGATIGSGPAGAITSAGSAAFAVMAYLVAITSSAAITKLVGDIDRLRATTTVTETPAETPAEPLPRRADRGRDALEEVGEAIAEGAADFLRSHGDPSERSHESARSHGEIEPTPTEEESQVSPSERDRSHEDDEASERLLTAQERRRLEGERNRARVARFLREQPDARTATIVAATGLGESTVRRIRKELEAGDG